MNGKKSKRLRKKGKGLLVAWLHSLLPNEEDKKEITIDNIESYLSDQTHIYANRKFLLSAYSLKWIYKRVKRNPDLTFEQLQKDLEQEQKAFDTIQNNIYDL
tara:strand:+ start:163 stop:468 length:306 start_codon:yes stop_codon:yes gene_type:complete